MEEKAKELFEKHVKNVMLIDSLVFDKIVESVYGKHYYFQQQNGCRYKGIDLYTVPVMGFKEEDQELNKLEDLNRVVNSNTMGIYFSDWLNTDYSTDNWNDNYHKLLWWERNFYPCPEMIINDLFDKGVLPKCELVIHIDW